MKYFCFWLLLLSISCQSNQGGRDKKIDLNINNSLNESNFILEDGIYIEKKPDSVANFSYSADNLIFTFNKEYFYSYFYILKGDTSLMRISVDSDKSISWNLVSADSIDIVPLPILN